MRFNESYADPNPFAQFKRWFDEACNSEIIDANGFSLATADRNGAPSSRMVLLKEYDERGFVFYTNYGSRKGKDLAQNPIASALFYWKELERQVRIEGAVEKVSKERSEEYFFTRPLESRLGAWASKQSRPLQSRFSLLRRVAGYAVKYPVNPPLPPHWGGYRIVPARFEFWQGRESRLHDRFEYLLEGDVWNSRRLYP